MQKISYSIIPADPAAHLFEITLRIAQPAADGQVLSLPAWIAGSYMIREFAKNIVSIAAASGKKPVALTKLDKDTWRAAPCKGPLAVTMQVYAWDLSVRTAHLDQHHGFFNGTSVFLRVHGAEHLPHEVELRAPKGVRNWKVATSLPRAGSGKSATKPQAFGLYVAPDYDALVDHPVEMGTFAAGSFEACGARHDIAITGRVPGLDMARLEADFKKICEAQIKLFEPKTSLAPFLDSSDRYVFMTMAVGDGYGGLEHRASTALVCNRSDLPQLGGAESSEGYRNFLGLVSHEYFHTWNVKRIKPAVFAPYDLSRETHTPLLWLFEGFTSYYDDLILARTGLMTEDQYLKALAKTVSGVLRGPGRFKQSVAQSSFDAWTKYYRQDENSPNAIVSYYTKGSLVALYLDLTIRTQTRGRRSLDDFMRLLWTRFGRDFYQGQPQGVAPEEIVGLMKQAIGLDLSRELHLATETTQDLPLEPLFAAMGISYSQRAEGNTPSLGVRTKASGTDCVIATAFNGEPAHAAGLSANDVIVAIDSLRATPANLDGLLARYRAGDTVTVHAFRRDELIETRVKLAAPPATSVKLIASDKAAADKRKLRRQWLAA